MRSPDVSVVIPTLGREKELAECIRSLSDDDLSIQWCVRRDALPLAAKRNRGILEARAPVTLLCDDDIVASPGYLRRMLSQMGQLGMCGITGPSRIPEAFRRNRDLFRYSALSALYDWVFVCDEDRPGHLTRAGTFVPTPAWSYEGPVQFLEACHMAFKTDVLKSVGGFDEAYGGVGDWSEPDLCFRLRRKFGDACLQFHSELAIEHCCASTGATVLRGADARQRLSNYRLFARRWVTPTWRHYLYQLFLTAYYSGYWGCRNLLIR